jgi:pimeloyl-ACP methyl ester carboxylesterase
MAIAPLPMIVAAMADPANHGMATTWTPTPTTLRRSSIRSVYTTRCWSAIPLAAARWPATLVAKAVLVGAVPPLMLKTAANPGGLPIEAFDQIRAGVSADRSQFYKDLSAPFYGANRPGAKVSQGIRDMFWLWSMQVGLKGDDDQIVPIADSALLSSKIVKGAILKIYPGAPHGLSSTHKDQFNADLLAFLRS